MQLPGRLRDTTLGDILGGLYRERVTGVLELVDGGRPDRVLHRIHLRDGQVVFVDGDDSGALSSDVLGRLEAAYGVNDAQLRFRVARPLGAVNSWVRTLSPGKVLHGRPRARHQAGQPRVSFGRRPGRTTEPEMPEQDGRAPLVRVRALQTLGLPGDADRACVVEAFRRLARELHPDRHPDASTVERARLMRRFAEVSAAYHALVA
jgi:hypothetical protein